MRVQIIKVKRIMKTKQITLFALAAATTMLTSCFKAEPLNMECDIQEAMVANTELFLHESDAKADISKDYFSNTIVFNNVRKQADLTAVAPEFVITPGATIEPASGTVLDFSDTRGQKYTVTSEDGQWNRTYTVKFFRADVPDPDEPDTKTTVEYQFENYFLSENGKYYIWSDLGPDEVPNWCSANAGYGIARSNAKPTEYPTTPDLDGYEGACVKLVTSSTGSWGAMTNKRLAAGNLFLGTFDLSKALSATLQSTRFGWPTYKKPLRFTGYYKYTPGEQMQDKNGNNIEGTDEGAIYAVLYKNHTPDGQAFTLTGEDVMTSPQRVAMARLPKVSASELWTAFDIEFEYWEDIDKAALLNLEYSLVLICSSSKDGDYYQGAIGSTLWVDKLGVEFE